jgi:signal transduction histidine kinase/ligand-binding sensor domain-containing protein
VNRIAAIILLITMQVYLFGQAPNLQFDHITLDEGLSSSSIVTIFQDYKGFLWIGTYNGLNRYDGHHFEVFRNDPFDSLSISSNHIWSIFEDSKKNLYIGTVGGLCEFDQEKNIFINHISLKTSPMYQQSWIVRCILEDDKENLWLATNLALVKYNREENVITQYQHDPNDPESLSNSNIEHILQDKQGNIWVSTWNGLNKFSPATGKANRYLYIPEIGPNLDEYSIMDLLLDNDDNMWVATYGTGLYKVSNLSGVTPVFKLYKNNSSDSRSLSGDRILSMFIDRKNRFWIGTENQGLNIYDRTNDNFWQYHKVDYDPKSLNHETINAIFEDNVGNIWIGTYAGGINLIRNTGNTFKLYQNLPGAPLSLSNNIVSAFLEDTKGNIWIATDGGGINLLNQKTGTFKRYNSTNTNLNCDNVLSIIECKNKNLWISSWAGGISSFNVENKTFHSYTTINSTIPDNNIFSLIEDENENLWLGSFQHGLIRFDKRLKSFTHFSVENSNILSNMILVIKYNNKGKLLLGTNRCFSVFDIAKEEFTNYLNDTGDPTSISSNSVYDICIENDTSVWIATQNGLNLFNPSTNKFFQFSTSDSLPDNIIKGLVFDENNQLWITTNSGICLFDPEEKKVMRIFTYADGLQGNEFNNNSVYELADGRILAGGTKGFNIIDPKNVRINRNPPVLRFTDFLIFNKRVNPNEKGAPIKKHISELDKITLNYDQSMLTFHFAVMDFTQPEKNQYAYQMVNFDNDWIYCGNKWEATYTNLNPGDYIFRVIGSNNDGVWNTEGISIQVTILPPWWKTIWFRSLLIFTILTLLFGFYLLRVNQLKNQKDKLELEVVRRTKEVKEKNELLIHQTEELNETNTLLEERQQMVEEQSEELQAQAEELTIANRELLNANATKDKFFSIIAHDLKNPFSSILGFTEVLKTKFQNFSEEKNIRMISLINESAENVFRLLENLLQWSRSQTGNLDYSPNEFNLSETIQNNIDLFQNQIKVKNLTIINHIPNEIKVVADRNMINTIVRNLISNAIKFTENGEIEIGIKKQSNFLKLYIRDTGIGIPKEKLKNLFEIGSSKSSEGTKGEMGTGLGLILCKEFAEKNGGKIKAVSKEDGGSTFTLIIPNKKV